MARKRLMLNFRGNKNGTRKKTRRGWPLEEEIESNDFTSSANKNQKDISGTKVDKYLKLPAILTCFGCASRRGHLRGSSLTVHELP